MRKAIIDLGTNTFNLLIAEVNTDGFEILFKTKEPVMLGMGGINQSILSIDAMERAFNAIKGFVGHCEEYAISASKIKAIGTSAVRSAKNRSTLIDKVKAELEVNISIVSGEEEARLIYEGVQWGTDFSEPSVIMDIGGGSTEFVSANSQGVQELISLDIGVSRLYQHLNCPNFYSQKEVDEINAYFFMRENGQLSGLECQNLIGSSGSFETFYEMIYGRSFSMKQGVVELPFAKLMEQLRWTISSTLEERKNHPWIIPIRQTMLPISAIQVLWAIERMSCQRVFLSPFSLKEGALK